MKAISWYGTLLILGPNTNISVEASRIVIENISNTAYLNFDDSPPIRERIEKEKQFAVLLPQIIIGVMTSLLSQEAVVVLDLVASIMQTSITQVPATPPQQNNEQQQPAV